MYNPSALAEVDNILAKYSYNEINELRYNIARYATGAKIRKHRILDICKELVKISLQSLKLENENEDKFLEPLILMLKKDKTPCDM